LYICKTASGKYYEGEINGVLSVSNGGFYLGRKVGKTFS
jgi:hypothetical protein